MQRDAYNKPTQISGMQDTGLELTRLHVRQMIAEQDLPKRREHWDDAMSHQNRAHVAGQMRGMAGAAIRQEEAGHQGWEAA